MDRRNFLHLIQTSTAAIILSPNVACSTLVKTDSAKRFGLTVTDLSIPLPSGKRIPFGWSAYGMNPGASVVFKLQEKLPEDHCWFRLSVAQEIWDEKLLHLHLPESGDYLGTIDIRYSSVLVPYEVEIDRNFVTEINKQGIKVTLESKSPFWLFTKTSDESTGLEPHILSAEKSSGTIDDFLKCFLSENSVQAFGWREGTVLDGLWQLYSLTGNQKALDVIHQHFDLFFDDAENLIYENAGSQPNDNHVDGIESTIPFATLARVSPEHPILKTVVQGWQNLKKDNGMIIDGNVVSAEGCYTVSYPMAVIGKAWNDENLKRNALEQLKHRFALIHDGNFYLRYYTDGRYTYKNWARGAAWFLLGFSRTIEELGKENVEDEILNKFREAVDIALSMQRSNGLWSCFMDDAGNSIPDTSGSAGIAAAIMTGINLGILPRQYQKNAERCYISLQDYITPDGFLKGVAQDNRGGEALQQSDYRVIAQMGMGMLAQLYATINH